MTELLLVGAGGALGSAARYLLARKIATATTSWFPAATFLINILGALLLGITVRAGIAGNLYLLFADGFLGAFTTFSTFMYEGFTLFKDKKRLNAVIYIAGSVVLGIAGFAAGMAIAGVFE